MSKTWQFRDEKPFIEKTSRPWMSGGGDRYEDGWKTYIVYDGNPVSVTWFPERMGLQLEGGDGLDERVGREIAIFALTLIKLMLSGDRFVQEV